MVVGEKSSPFLTVPPVFSTISRSFPDLVVTDNGSAFNRCRIAGALQLKDRTTPRRAADWAVPGVLNIHGIEVQNTAPDQRCGKLSESVFSVLRHRDNAPVFHRAQRSGLTDTPNPDPAPVSFDLFKAMGALFGRYPSMLMLYADCGYQEPEFPERARKVRRKVDVEIVQRTEAGKFVALPRPLSSPQAATAGQWMGGRADHRMAQSLPPPGRGLRVAEPERIGVPGWASIRSMLRRPCQERILRRARGATCVTLATAQCSHEMAHPQHPARWPGEVRRRAVRRTDRHALPVGLIATDPTATATCAMDASAPEWVHLFALGKMTARDGGAFDLADAEGLKRDFDARRVDLPVDYEHESETALPDRTGPVPAAGWIKELRVDARGLWGRVEWTEQARELIGAKACRYPSPAPNHRRGNNVMTRLKGAGLFHHPDLERTALASQEDTMADDPAKDRAEPDDGTMMQRMIAMLKLPDDTDAKTLMKGVEEMLSNGSKPDPAKFVPIEVMQELLHDRGRQAATRGGSRAVQQVGEAFRRGDPTTPMRDWATALCRSDEAAFDAFIATSVPMSRHPTRPTGTGAQAPQHLADAAVSEIETAICGQLGLKPGSLIA